MARVSATISWMPSGERVRLALMFLGVTLTVSSIVSLALQSTSDKTLVLALLGVLVYSLLFLVLRDLVLATLAAIIFLASLAFTLKIPLFGAFFSPTLPFTLLLIATFGLAIPTRATKPWLPFLPVVALYLAAVIASLYKSLFLTESIVGVIYLIFFFLVFYSVINLVRTRRQVTAVFYCLALSAITVTFILLVEFLRTGESLVRLGQLFNTRNAASAYLLPVLPLLAVLAVTHRNKLWWVLPVLGMGVLFLLGSRFGLVALALGMMAAFPGKRNYLRFGAAGAVVLLVVSLAAPTVWQSYLAGFRSVVDQDYLAQSFQSTWWNTEKLTAGSVVMRWAAFGAGLNMFHDSPLIGQGFSTSFYNTGLYALSGLTPFEVDLSEYYLHSTPLTSLAETGLLGFSAMLALQIGIILYLVKAVRRLPPGKDKLWVQGLLGGVVGLFAFYVGLNGLNTTFDFLYLGFSLAAARVLTRSPAAEGTPQGKEGALVAPPARTIGPGDV